MAKKDEPVVESASREVVHWKDKMVALTKQTQIAEKPQGGFISLKGGRMSYNDELLPGDKINAIIVDYRFDNELYMKKYDPKNPRSPECFAIVAPGSTLSPWKMDPITGEYSTDAEFPQVNEGFECEGCPMNEWGSAGKLEGADPTSKGKACKTTRRLHLIAADDARSPEAIARASVVTLIPPATSVENFQLVMNQISKVLDAPMFGAVVEISVKPHDRFLYQVHFKILQQITDDDMLQALMAKYEQQASRVVTYPKNSERDGSAPDPRTQSSKY